MADGIFPPFEDAPESLSGFQLSNVFPYMDGLYCTVLYCTGVIGGMEDWSSGAEHLAEVLSTTASALTTPALESALQE